MDTPSFHLGTNISTICVKIGGKPKIFCESTSEILSKCYPDLSVQPPLPIKTLIGQKFSDLNLHSSDYLIGTKITKGHDGFPVFHTSNGLLVTIPQILSKSLLHLCEKFILQYKRRVKKFTTLCCIGVPVYFTDLQRRIMQDAAKQAGFINGVMLTNETTASAIAFQELNKIREGELYVAFVDIGITGMQVCIVEYAESDICILSQAFDCSLGGRAFDTVLLNHFVVKFRDEHHIDAENNADLYWKLRSVCEKMKIDLSSSEDASFQVTWGDKELIGSLKREEFVRMCAPLLDRVKIPLEKALDDAGLSVEKFHSVQCVGLASQIPVIIKIITDIFGRKPNHIKVQKDSAALGWRIGRYNRVIEVIPYSIVMSWDKNNVAIDEDSACFFPKGSFECERTISFSGFVPFYLDFMYDDVTDPRFATTIGTFKIAPSTSYSTGKVQGKLKVSFTDGIVVLRINEEQYVSKNTGFIILCPSRITELKELDEEPNQHEQVDNNLHKSKKLEETNHLTIEEKEEQMDLLDTPEKKT